VLDAELVEPLGPALELGPVGAAEGDMVEADPELAEPLVGSGLACWCNPSRVLPSRYTVWRKSGSVSSSSTGSASRSAWYQGTLADRSRTVRATWVRAGNSANELLLPGGIRAGATARSDPVAAVG